MTDYVVFFRTMTDEQREQLNAGGWSSPIGMAYSDAEPVGARTPVWAGAIEHDLFELAATVRECPDRDFLYDLMQNGRANWSCEPSIRAFTDFPRSMSKGDVIYDGDVGEWSYVATCGFETIEDEAFIAHLKGKILSLEATAGMSP